MKTKMKETSKNHETANSDLGAVRRSALTWWNSMSFEEQFYKTIDWLKSQNRNTTERHPHHLTDVEIQEINEFFNPPKRICYKTNEVCKYNCPGICRDSV